MTDVTPLTPNSERLSTMDIHRGLIMTLMAFAHCREYVGGGHYYSNLYWHYSPVWLDASLINFVQQMLISTVASGGFFMMMGIGNETVSLASYFAMSKYPPSPTT